MRNDERNRLLELSNIKKEKKETTNKGLLSKTLLWYREAHDNNVYGIFKEGHGYAIKVAKSKINLNESDFSYIDGIKRKDKSFEDSYSDALRRVGFLFSELNSKVDEPVSFNINESEDSKKYVLKLDLPPQAKQPEINEPEGGNMPPIDNSLTSDSVSDNPLDAEQYSDQEISDSLTGNENSGPEDIELVKKDVSSLTGQLAQKIRSSESELDKSDYKSVFNSIASAIDFSKFTDSELEQLKDRVSREDVGSEENANSEMGDENMEQSGEETQTTELPTDGEPDIENSEVKEESSVSMTKEGESDIIPDEIPSEELIGKKVKLTARIASAKPFGDGNKFFKVRLTNGEKLTATRDELQAMVVETELKETALKSMKKNAKIISEKYNDKIYKDYSRYFNLIKESEGLDEFNFNVKLFSDWKKKVL